jgi:LmbE family N-acetylglucosaminyl deacetylase
VVCVTATRGEGGSTDEERWPPATLAAVRERELLRSFEILGVGEHRFLDLPDVDMESQVGGMIEAFGPDLFRRAMAEECFRLGARKDVP